MVSSSRRKNGEGGNVRSYRRGSSDRVWLKELRDLTYLIYQPVLGSGS